MPILWEREPDLVLHVVGADPTPAVEALHGERINVVGYVDDPAEWLDRTRVHVSPMRYGAGIKLKLLDTIAAGHPFVTTAVGAEGLPLGNLRAQLVAEQPLRLAELTHALYTDERAVGEGAGRRARHRSEQLRPRDVQADAGRGDEPPRDASASGCVRRSPARARRGSSRLLRKRVASPRGRRSRWGELPRRSASARRG